MASVCQALVWVMRAMGLDLLEQTLAIQGMALVDLVL
jgi:hypothetical protein